MASEASTTSNNIFQGNQEPTNTPVQSASISPRDIAMLTEQKYNLEAEIDALRDEADRLRASRTPKGDKNQAAAPELTESLGKIAKSLEGAFKDAKDATQKKGSYVTGEAATFIQSNLGALTRSKRKGFVQAVWNQADIHDDRARALKVISEMNVTISEQMRMMKESDLNDINKRIAATIYECLDKDHAFPKMILAATLDDPELGNNGLKLILYIKNGGGVCGGYQSGKSAKAEFDKKTFYKPGLSEEENLAHGIDVISEIKALPAEYRAHKHSMHHLMLDKIPRSCRSSNWAQQLITQLDMATHDGDGEAPWTPNGLNAKISYFLSQEMFEPSNPMANRTERNTPSDAGARARRFEGKDVEGVLIKWFGDKQYGFVTIDGEDSDIFIHTNEINGNPTRDMGLKFRIRYDARKGRDYAVSATPTPAPPSANHADAGRTANGGTQTVPTAAAAQVMSTAAQGAVTMFMPTVL